MCRNNKRPLIVLKFFKEQAVKQFPVVCVKPQNWLIKDYIRNIQ